MSKRRSASGDCPIGYGRPPRANQFQRGQSGNPRGRPKGSRSVPAILGDALHRKVAVTENGRSRRITMLEVMLRRLTNDAARGDPRAIKLLLDVYGRYRDRGESPGVSSKDLAAEDLEILAAYLPTAESGDDPE